MDVAVAEEKDAALRRRIVEALTARLPEWFAQGQSNRHYAEQADVLQALVARTDGEPVGLLMLKRHSAISAEIYWLGVEPDRHRQGVGRALVASAEHRLKQEKVKFLFVVTLHPKDPYEPYQGTRAFYERIGFELVLSAARGPIGCSPDTLAYYLKLL